MTTPNNDPPPLPVFVPREPIVRGLIWALLCNKWLAEDRERLRLLMARDE